VDRCRKDSAEARLLFAGSTRYHAFSWLDCKGHGSQVSPDQMCNFGSETGLSYRIRDFTAVRYTECLLFQQLAYIYSHGNIELQGENHLH